MLTTRWPERYAVPTATAARPATSEIAPESLCVALRATGLTDARCDVQLKSAATRLNRVSCCRHRHTHTLPEAKCHAHESPRSVLLEGLV